MTKTHFAASRDRGLHGGGSGETRMDRMQARISTDAVRILETVLHRSRWSIADRDALATAMLSVVRREMDITRGRVADQFPAPEK